MSGHIVVSCAQAKVTPESYPSLRLDGVAAMLPSETTLP